MTKVIMVRLIPGEPSLVPASRAHKAAAVLKAPRKERRG